MAIAEIPQQQSVPSATPVSASAPRKGLRLERHFTREGVHPYDEIDWELRDAVIPGEGGNVVRSMTRKRNRVIEAPVLFTNRRRIESVPDVEFCPGLLVKSRTRFGGLAVLTFASSEFAVTTLLR